MKVKQQAFSIHSQSTKVKVSMLSQTLNHVHLTSFFTQPTKKEGIILNFPAFDVPRS